MALLNIRCPLCNEEHEVDDASLGQIAECSNCSKEFVLRLEEVSSMDKPVPSIELAKQLWNQTIDSDFSPEMSIKPDSKSEESTFIPNVVLREFIISHDPENPEEGCQYTLLTEIGKGGMGVVYRAHQASTDRKVALKLILPEKRGSEEKAMSFLTEAVVTANLDHPNIMPVYDVGYDQDRNPFYSMKEITGKSWLSVMKSKTEQENIQILLDVCDAVAYAHDQGVIHRDLKPENVMIGEYGEVVVVDWGLAAGFGEEGTHKAEPLSKQSSSGGTAAYMSPEMADCDFSAIGPGSDIYLLGGILYQIVTGLVPHKADNIFATIYAAMANKIQKTDKTGELVDIALQAMGTKPEYRFASVKGFKNAISASLTHSESIILQKSAEQNLAEAEKIGDYKLYAQAQFGFSEAIKQWPDNKEAQKGLNKATLAYATCALKKDDLELVQSLLDGKKSEHKDLFGKANKQQNARMARKRHNKILIASSISLMIAIIVVLILAFQWVKNEQENAVRAKNEAVTAQKTALEAEQKAKDEELRAKKLLAEVKQERDKTKQALLRIEEEENKVNMAKKDSDIAYDLLKDEKNRLIGKVAPKHLKDALAHYNKCRWVQALASLNLALDLNDKLPEANLLRTKLYLADHKLLKAKETLEKAGLAPVYITKLLYKYMRITKSKKYKFTLMQFLDLLNDLEQNDRHLLKYALKAEMEQEIVDKRMKFVIQALKEKNPKQKTINCKYKLLKDHTLNINLSYNTALKNIEPLFWLKISKLNLSHTNVKDLSPLVNSFYFLKTVNMKGTEINDSHQGNPKDLIPIKNYVELQKASCLYLGFDKNSLFPSQSQNGKYFLNSNLKNSKIFLSGIVGFKKGIMNETLSKGVVELEPIKIKNGSLSFWYLRGIGTIFTIGNFYRKNSCTFEKNEVILKSEHRNVLHDYKKKYNHKKRIWEMKGNTDIKSENIDLENYEFKKGWHFINLVFEEKYISLFVDGSFIGAIKRFYRDIPLSNLKMKPFVIDELTFVEKILTQKEIKTIFASYKNKKNE